MKKPWAESHPGGVNAVSPGPGRYDRGPGDMASKKVRPGGVRVVRRFGRA